MINRIIVSIPKFLIVIGSPMLICYTMGARSHGYLITGIQFELLYLDTHEFRKLFTHALIFKTCGKRY